jgi:hypothetical protein
VERCPTVRERGLKGALLKLKPFVQEKHGAITCRYGKGAKITVQVKARDFAGKALEKVLPPQLRKYAKLLGVSGGTWRCRVGFNGCSRVKADSWVFDLLRLGGGFG